MVAPTFYEGRLAGCRPVLRAHLSHRVGAVPAADSQSFDLLSADRTPSELDISGIFVLGMWAPALAAVAMRLFISKEGLRGSLGPRVPQYYALALAIPASRSANRAQAMSHVGLTPGSAAQRLRVRLP